ncbi:cell wall-binding repeat-containing protein [Clostridioides difficile]|nr:cell wall-binding repeat-containing protein [Clostridioides difficile]
MKLSKKLLAIGISISLLIVSCPISNALSSISSIKGVNKYETAGLIADKQNYDTAILINSENGLSDGLSASGLAGAKNAPILLTKKDTIPSETLKRLEKVKEVYLIGGEKSIGVSVQKVLIDKKININRISGTDRIDTSHKVAKEIGSVSAVKKVILANAFKGEPDAISAASVAVRDKAAIILTDGNTTNFATDGLETYAIGGKASMNDKLINETKATRIGGVDRYDTNKQIINKFYNGSKEFYIASGTDLVYSLVGSTIAQKAPIVLVGNGSNKSILKNASKITAIGNIDDSVTKQCLNITNNIGDSNTGIVKDTNSNNTNKPSNEPSSNNSGLTDKSIVYVVPNGKSYHLTKNCSTLKRSKTINKVTLKQAKSQGKTDPCNVCVR